MLQPTQVLLFSFYRMLSLVTLGYYLSLYYGFLLILSLFVLLSPWAIFLTPIVLLLGSLLLVSLCIFMGSVEAIGDLRVTLAVSTLVNVTLLLLAVAAVQV